MKFFCITFIRKSAWICIFLLFGHELFAQKVTESPYSRFGVGLNRPVLFNGNFGSSGSAYAWRPSNYRPAVYDSLARSGATFNDRNTNYINPANPASFSNLSLTTYEAGFFSQSTRYENESQSRNFNYAGFSHIAIAFPIGNRWGAGFGIRPFSQIGYDYQRESTLNGNPQTFDFDGSGGINEVFVGIGTQISPNFALGVNGKFLFGQKTEIRRVVYGNGFSNDFFNTLDQNNINFNDLSVDIGLQYFKDINRKSRIIAGVTVSPLSDIAATQNRLIRTYEGREGFEQIKDTVFQQEENEVEFNLGSRTGFGLAFEKKGAWIVMADYTFIDRDNVFIEEEVFATDEHRMSVGFENFTSQSVFGSYFKRLGYRLGAHYSNSIIRIAGEDIPEFGISFGLVLPMRKSFSTLSFSVEAGERGTISQNLIREQFINFHVGVTINDKWFIKRKYD